jgi:hypothetical protein
VTLRLTAALLALAAGAAAVALAALLLRSTPGPVSTAPAPVPTASSSSTPSAPSRRFPAPPAGAIVFSREDGPNALAVAIAKTSAQVSVVGQQGKGVSGLAVTVNGTRTSACGAGCYRASVSKVRELDVHVGATRWLVTVPAARDASALVARAAHVWRSLHSLAFTDRLGSDRTHVVVSEWRAVAPNRLAYVIPGGYSAVIVGGKRWDRAPGGRWVESPQTAQLRQPVPVWQSATDAHVVGETAKAWEITFYDPGTPAWFAITVDKRTARTLDLRMTTTAHFMHERYRSFDAPLAVTPPG